MDFIDQLKQFSKCIETLKDGISTEEATKTSIIMPFFSLLGYDVFNPAEFVPEFTADVGIKKGEKVDYAILLNGEPVILIECKWIGEKLDKHDSQLFRYYGTSKAKFAILTNGQCFKFYTDLEDSNKMDETPFLEIDMLDIKENQVSELKKFTKAQFNIEEIFDTASELKYSNSFKSLMSEQLQQPTDDFTRFFLLNSYDGKLTKAVLDKFKPILKKALNNHISEMMSDKIKSALSVNTSKDESEITIPVGEIEVVVNESKINTTNEELEAYFIIKNILKDVCSIKEISYKDTESYLGILYQNKVTKWVCRLSLYENKKILIIPGENKKDVVKYILNDIYEIENHADELKEVLLGFMNKKVWLKFNIALFPNNVIYSYIIVHINVNVNSDFTFL